MKRLRSVALCGVAALAVSVVVAASASAALPEYGGPFPKSFTSKVVVPKTGSAILIEVSGIKLTCTGGTNTGELTGAKSGNVVVRLTGCEGDGFKCTSPGAKEGEVVTSKLATTLGYINKEKKEVGIALEAVGSTPFDEMECDSIKFVVIGSVIGKITPINKKVKPPAHFTLKFSQAKAVQKPRKLEGGETDVLEGYIAGEPKTKLAAGLKATDEIKLTETGEIKA